MSGEPNRLIATTSTHALLWIQDQPPLASVQDRSLQQATSAAPQIERMIVHWASLERADRKRGARLRLRLPHRAQRPDR